MISAPTVQVFGWVKVVVAQRWRAICSALVGRPRGRCGDGGSAGLVDSIQASTSRSYQHSLRLPGILNGRGIRWLHLELVAKVRIVVTLLPSIRDKSSVKSTRTGGRWGVKGRERWECQLALLAAGEVAWLENSS